MKGVNQMKFVFRADNVVDPTKTIKAVFKSRAAAIRQTKAHSLERHFVKEAALGDKLVRHQHPVVYTIEVTL